MTKDFTLALFALIFGILSLYIVTTKVPRLVGYECIGSQGPLYANEEDDFPACGAIEEY